jgi:hypothetical protein
MTASWNCCGPAAIVPRAIDPDLLAGHAFGLDDYAEAFRVSTDPEAPDVKVATIL